MNLVTSTLILATVVCAMTFLDDCNNATLVFGGLYVKVRLQVECRTKQSISTSIHTLTLDNFIGNRNGRLAFSNESVSPPFTTSVPFAACIETTWLTRSHASCRICSGHFFRSCGNCVGVEVSSPRDFMIGCDCLNEEGKIVGINPWIIDARTGWLSIRASGAFSSLHLLLTTSHRSYPLTTCWLGDKVVYKDGSLQLIENYTVDEKSIMNTRVDSLVPFVLIVGWDPWTRLHTELECFSATNSDLPLIVDSILCRGPANCFVTRPQVVPQ